MVDETIGARQVLMVRVINMEAPWTWLALGWRDMWRRPGISLTWGTAFALGSLAITFVLWWVGMLELLLPLAAGFTLIGPMIAVGLYETS